MHDQPSDEMTQRLYALVERLATDHLDNGRTIDATTPLFIGDEQGALFDSFEAVLLFIELENEFGFHIDDEDMTLENFNTIGQIAEYIAARAQPAA